MDLSTIVTCDSSPPIGAALPLLTNSKSSVAYAYAYVCQPVPCPYAHDPHLPHMALPCPYSLPLPHGGHLVPPLLCLLFASSPPLPCPSLAPSLPY